MDAEIWLTPSKWAAVGGGPVATLGGVGVWYFEPRVAWSRAPVAAPFVGAINAPPAPSVPAPETAGARPPESGP